MKIQFEKSRAFVPVPPGCPIWHPKGEPRIPLVRMETQHIKNCMGYLLRVGLPEMASCEMYHYRVQNPVRNHSGTTAMCFLVDSVRRLKYLDLWYGRFVEELERRRLDGEEVGDYPARISTESSSNKTRRARIVGAVDRLRNLLPAPKEGARDQ